MTDSKGRNAAVLLTRLLTLTKLVRRNLFRNKVRLLLTVLGAAVAVLTFVTLHTALNSWNHAKEFSQRDRIYTRHKITFIIPLPKRYVEDARNAKGPDGAPLLRNVSYASWFGGREPNHPNDFFSSMAIDGDTYFDVFDDFHVPAAEREAFMKDRSGAIIGEVLAEKFGWKIGDRVTLDCPLYPAPEGKPWTFNVAGIYRTRPGQDRSTFLFHWARLEESLPPHRQGNVGWLISRTSDPSRSAEVSTQIDALFEDRDVQTTSQDERAFTSGFMEMISTVLNMMGILSLVILAIMGLILANAVGMSTRERSGEYAALKAVGFKPRHIVFLVTVESTMVALLGGLLGLLLSHAIVDGGMKGFFEKNLSGVFPVFQVDVSTVVMALVAALLLGGAAAAVPALRASRLSVTDALRRVA